MESAAGGFVGVGGMADLARILALVEGSLLTVAGVFTRVAAVAFLLPGLGERGLALRLRLGAALALTLLLAPMVGPLVPLTPGTVPGVAAMLAAEATAGLTIGLAFRLLIFALQTAGMVAAYHMSITHLFGAGVSQEPEPTIATLLGMGGVVLALQTGLHVAAVSALAELYGVLPFGRFPEPADLGLWSVERVSEVFALGLSLALPFVAVGFAYNLALGALSRAMPQLLVALVGVPLLVFLGMLTLWLALPAIFRRWAEALAGVFADPLGGLLR